MEIKNDRIYLAIKALITGVGDVRARVVIACRILERIHKSELEKEVYGRIQILLEKAGEKGPLRTANGDVLRDKYQRTAEGRHNRTYKGYAEEILSIYDSLPNE